MNRGCTVSEHLQKNDTSLSISCFLCRALTYSGNFVLLMDTEAQRQCCRKDVTQGK